MARKHTVVARHIPIFCFTRSELQEDWAFVEDELGTLGYSELHAVEIWQVSARCGQRGAGCGGCIAIGLRVGKQFDVNLVCFIDSQIGPHVLWLRRRIRTTIEPINEFDEIWDIPIREPGKSIRI